MPLILPGNVATATAPTTYQVANSCRFNDGDSAYMHKTPSADGNRRTFTFSCWVKRGELSSHNPIAEVYSSGENVSQFYFNATDQFTWYESQTSNKINLTFVPIGDVKIIWMKIGEHELTQPFITTFNDSGRFNSIEFDYEKKSILFHTVYNDGQIVFADKIKSVLIDKQPYNNFQGNVLNTLPGKHEYSIFLE